MTIDCESEEVCERGYQPETTDLSRTLFSQVLCDNSIVKDQLRHCFLVSLLSRSFP